MNKSQKNQKTVLWGSMIGSALLIAAGVLLVCNPDFGSAAVAMVVGWVLVAFGALGLFVSIVSWPAFGIPETALCALALGFGIYILCNPLSLASIAGVALGVWLAVQGLSAVRESVYLKKQYGVSDAELIFGALMIVLGVILVIFPLTTSRVVMVIVGIALAICGGANLVFRARSAKYLHKASGRVIDADE